MFAIFHAVNRPISLVNPVGTRGWGLGGFFLLLCPSLTALLLAKRGFQSSC